MITKYLETDVVQWFQIFFYSRMINFFKFGVFLARFETNIFILMLLHSLFMWPEHPHCQWNQFKLISFIMYTTQQSTSIMDPNQIRGNSVFVLNANCVDFAIMPFQAWQSKRDTATDVFFNICWQFNKLSLDLIDAESSKK